MLAQVIWLTPSLREVMGSIPVMISDSDFKQLLDEVEHDIMN